MTGRLSTFSDGGVSQMKATDAFPDDCVPEDVLCSVFIRKSLQNSALLEVGVCIFDRQKLKFYISEFNSSSHMTLLEAILLQMNISSMIAPQTSGENSYRVSAVASALGVNYNTVKKGLFDETKLEYLLPSLLPSETTLTKLQTKELRLRSACAAAAALIEYWELSHDMSINHSCSFSVYSHTTYMQVDAAASHALNIFNSQSNKGKVLQLLPCNGKYGAENAAKNDRKSAFAAAAAGEVGTISSIFSLLQKNCSTALGVRRLHIILSQPLIDVDEINKRLDVVEAFVQDEEFRRCVFSSHFKHVGDLDRLAAKLHRIHASTRDDADDNAKKGVAVSRFGCKLEDLVRLYDCVVEVDSLHTAINRYEGKNSESLKGFLCGTLKELITNFAPYLQLVEHTIDMEEAKNNSFVISRKFDKRLQEGLVRKSEIRDKIEKHRKQVVENLELYDKKDAAAGGVKLVQDGTLGHVFRIVKKDQGRVQSKKGRYQTLRLNKNELLFTTSYLRDLCNELRDVDEEYEAIQEHLLAKCLTVSSTYWCLVETLADFLGLLDVLGAFARLCTTAPAVYTRPNIVLDGKRLMLKASRHALIEQQPHISSFISNDVNLEMENSHLQLITGPNMGGKSTFIRQVGLTVLLAQIGCFVPCSYCEMPIFTQLMCRIGAFDMQQKGVSTFFAEMVEAAAIIDAATEKSLVIVDELGRGTSTSEGFGLAWAIARHLAEKSKCFTLFATHFHEMGALSDEISGVKNLHVEADACPIEKKLTFLYSVKQGCADKSYGVHVAEFAGFPSTVVKRAGQKASELEWFQRGTIKRRRNCDDSKEDNKDDDNVLKHDESKTNWVEVPAELANVVKDIFNAENSDNFALQAQRKGPMLKEAFEKFENWAAKATTVV